MGIVDNGFILLQNAYRLHRIYWRYKSLKGNNKPTCPRKEGDKIVILGNGPSQKLYWEHAERFKDYKLLCMNEFPYYERERFLLAQPDYYCAVDPVATSIEGADAFGAEYLGIMREKINLFNECVTWKMSYITWADNCNFFNNPSIGRISIPHITCDDVVEHERIRLFEKNIATVNAESVSLVALFFALVFGFEEIALFGIDFDFSIGISENNEVLGITPHSYCDKPAQVPIRDGRGEHWIYEVYEGVATVHREFVMLRRFANYRNAKVINYNPKSLVDAFEKKRL